MAGSASKIIAKPESANMQERVAIVAGGGNIPLLLAEHLESQGIDPFIFLLRGDASNELMRFEHEFMSAAMYGKLIATMRRKKIFKVVLIGSVNQRPTITDFRLNLATLRVAGRAIAALAKGDDKLLKHVIEIITEAGIEVVSAHDLMPSLLTPKGLIVGKKLTAGLIESMEIGADAAKRLGDLDAGQGCVIIKQRIVALEGVEGTDEMLKRVGELRASGRLRDKREGILVKMCKPQQDQRVDLPTIGPTTIKNAIAAKLQAVAIESGSSYLVDIAEMVDLAQNNNLTIYGIPSATAAQNDE